MHFTRLSEVEIELKNVICEAKRLSKQVVILHGGNVGSAEIIPWPLKRLFSWRTKKFRDLYSKVCQNEKVIYVDMFTKMKHFPHYRNGVSTYAKDSFHPSDEGYAIWFELIQKALFEKSSH